MMDILKNPIELSATVVESFIILEFLGKVLGYKHDGVKKQLLFYSSLIVAVTYITFVSTLKSFGGLLDLVAIGIFILHGVFCLRDKLLKKILFP
ncbi:MAG: hypothetical protein FWH07_06955, partial [Oscillospiraceae bacterium]|nr:hypothetical protein [Oscillospiraceae bacterium]